MTTTDTAITTNPLAVRQTVIPGFYEIDLTVHGDNRGWFKENYQKEKMEALGLPAFDIVQNNFSFNAEVGVTRGLHAEPWEKFVSVANGRVFGAWVDLRAGPSYGQTLTLEITPGKAVFVPRGVANGYQTLEPNVTYTYLVNAHWSADAQYTFVNLFDPALGIDWPISQDKAIISDKDAAHPTLQDVIPMEV
jgi:dTDP-4-dehydrorhamnose 3,5-epimerase